MRVCVCVVKLYVKLKINKYSLNFIIVLFYLYSIKFCNFNLCKSCILRVLIRDIFKIPKIGTVMQLSEQLTGLAEKVINKQQKQCSCVLIRTNEMRGF